MPSKSRCIMLKGTTSNYEVNIPRGKYLFELFGASAGTSNLGQLNPGGKGGYVSGEIMIKTAKKLLFFVGTKGTDSNRGTEGKGGFNGGSDGAKDNQNNDCASAGSGGSTDVRIDASPDTRIMVAGGGGSSGCFSNAGLGGHAGGLIGEDGKNNNDGTCTGGSGGTQTSGYLKVNGGIGTPGNEAGGSGGGGYWGGIGGSAITNGGKGGGGGGGGSSYVSGHPNCTQFRDFVFRKILIIPGNSIMINPETNVYDLNGHTGDGYAIITYLQPLCMYTCKRNTGSSFAYLTMIFVIRS